MLYESCGEAAALGDWPENKRASGAAGDDGGVQDTLYQALMDGTDMTGQSADRGAEHDGKVFPPRE